MELSFRNGIFVADQGHMNYQKVLDDFTNAKTIRIMTYNISKNERYDPLMAALDEVEADVQIVTNVPGRFEKYYDSPAGKALRNKAKDNISVYIRKLDPDAFQSSLKPFFNIHNHAKLIGTENIVYIGSANYSNESNNNIESGVLISDKEFIQRLYTEFFDMIKIQSLSYEDEFFSEFRLLVMALQAKFKMHYEKIIQSLYIEFQGKKVLSSSTIILDISDLDSLNLDLDELNSLSFVAEDTYDEDDSHYNEELSELIETFSQLSIEWLQSVISEDGTLYDLVLFDQNENAIDRLQNEYSAEAYDEYLEEYAQRAVDEAGSAYEELYFDFEKEAEDFLKEFEKIISALEKASDFAAKWRPSKIAPGLDNT